MPIDKVAAGGYAGLLSTVLVGLLGVVHVALPPAGIAALITLIIFGVSYLKTETKLGPIIEEAEQYIPRHAAGE